MILDRVCLRAGRNGESLTSLGPGMVQRGTPRAAYLQSSRLRRPPVPKTQRAGRFDTVPNGPDFVSAGRQHAIDFFLISDMNCVLNRPGSPGGSLV